MKIVIVGTGYIGLVTGVCFAEKGFDVHCIDLDQTKIDNLYKGIMPIYEHGLKEMVMSNLERKTISFSTNLKESMIGAKTIFICVGTPMNKDGHANLSYVMTCAENIGDYIDNYVCVVVKSTVPVGTCDKVETIIKNKIQDRNINIEFDIVSNPEFLKEGVAIDDCLSPDRVVIGFHTDKSKTIMSKLYEPFNLNKNKLIFMDIRSSELTKYTSNAMLATRVSFMNEIAALSEKVNANIDYVRKGIGSDLRIGPKFLNAGTGYGGSCFPKDVSALIKTAQSVDHSLEILKSVHNVNEKQKYVLIDKLKEYLSNQLKDKLIAVWGLSFKPDTDDIRDAPSITIVNELINSGASVIAYDPVAIDVFKSYFEKHQFSEQIQYGKDPYDVLKSADALLIVTEWKEFINSDINKVKNILENKPIFDGRNIYDLKVATDINLNYFSIGRA